MDWQNKKVLIVGLKASGLAAYELLKKKGAIPYIFDDDRTISFDGKENLANQEDLFYLAEVDAVVVSPSIPDNHKIVVEAKNLKLPIYSELAVGLAELEYPVIAITGTNGKTTTTLMLEKLLTIAGYKVKAAGNVGYPVCQLAQSKKDYDYAIVEVSSFQLNYGEVKPYIGVILNIAADHLDRYADFDAYAWAKLKLFENADKKDYCIVNISDENIMSRLKHINGNLIKVSTKKEEGVAYLKDNYFFYNGKPLASVKDFKPKGEHNRFNALVALSVASVIGIPPSACVSFLRKYKLPPHRIEYIATVNGKSYFNDSKGTNLHATTAAIEMIEDNIGLIMGGSDKNEDYCDFFERIPEKVKQVAVTGANAEKIMNSAYKVGYFDIVMHQTLESAVFTLAKSTDVNNILFSPSSASFDRYANYEERGNAFKQMVFRVKA